ncbi:MAG: hypothetical protein QXY40_04250 [Candidatus Methanomethylicia archaeon]
MSGKVKPQLRILEKILSYIPGYRGYKEKEVRRETDRLVRMEATSKLRRAKKELRIQLSNPIVISKLNDEDKWVFDQLLNRMDRITQRIDKAIAGYSGFFDIVKVDEWRLDKVIEHDLSLIEKTEEILRKVRDASSKTPGSEDWRKCLTELTELTEEIDQLIDCRVEILKSIEV